MTSKLDKVYREGDRVYLQPGEEPPPGAQVEQGPRGGRFFRWQAASGHGGWERRRRTARRGARLAQAEAPRPGSLVSTQRGPARVTQMLPSGGAVVETQDGRARLGPEALADATKRTQLEELADQGKIPTSPTELINLCIQDSAKANQVLEAIYSTPGYPVETVSLKVHRNRAVGFKANIFNDRGHKVGHLSRLLWDDGSDTVYHDLFELERGFQGGGLAARMNRQAEMAYLAMGYKKVDLNADIDVGKYAWARQGYDFKFNADREGVRYSFAQFLARELALPRAEADRKAEELIPKDAHSWDIAALDDGRLYHSGEKGSFPLGKAFMLSRACPAWSGQKEITPGSPGWLVGQAYLNAADSKPRGRLKAAALDNRRSPFILPKEMAGLGGDDSAHWAIDEAADSRWRHRLSRMNNK